MTASLSASMGAMKIGQMTDGLRRPPCYLGGASLARVVCPARAKLGAFLLGRWADVLSLHLHNRRPVLLSRSEPLAGDLICWRSTPTARRSRTNYEAYEAYSDHASLSTEARFASAWANLA